MLVVAYSVSHRLFEFAWKGQLRTLFPSALAYQARARPPAHGTVRARARRRVSWCLGEPAPCARPAALAHWARLHPVLLPRKLARRLPERKVSSVDKGPAARALARRRWPAGHAGPPGMLCAGWLLHTQRPPSE